MLLFRLYILKYAHCNWILLCQKDCACMLINPSVDRCRMPTNMIDVTCRFHVAMLRNNLDLMKQSRCDWCHLQSLRSYDAVRPAFVRPHGNIQLCGLSSHTDQYD